MKRIIVCFIFFVFINAAVAQTARVSGTIKNLTGTKMIKCSMIRNSVLEPISAISIPLEAGHFSQLLDIEKTTFLSFEEGKNYYAGFIQPGDSIVISYDATDFKNSLSFSGKGQEKFSITQPINRLRNDFNAEANTAKEKTFPIDYFFSGVDSASAEISSKLAAAKALMSDESYEQISAYLASVVLTTKYFGAQNIFGDSYNNILANHQAKLSAASKIYLQQLLQFNGNWANSFFYSRAVYNMLSIHYESNVMKEGDEIKTKYAYIKQQVAGALRPAILYLFLKSEIKNNNNEMVDPVIEQSFVARDSSYKNRLFNDLSVSRKLKNGSPAPEFLLEDKAGKKVSLASFKGKIVYLDFWFATCGPCHRAFAESKAAKEYFRPDTNVVFLMVSVDNREVWEKALKKFDIPGYHVFTGGSFRNHPVIKMYSITGYPTTCLIDGNGIIADTNPPNNSDELKKEIEKLLRAKPD